MNEAPLQTQSYLFTLRFWRTDPGSGETEWRGKLQYVVSGETRYFQDWPELVLYLKEMLAAPIKDGKTAVNRDRF